MSHEMRLDWLKKLTDERDALKAEVERERERSEKLATEIQRIKDFATTEGPIGNTAARLRVVFDIASQALLAAKRDEGDV